MQIQVMIALANINIDQCREADPVGQLWAMKKMICKPTGTPRTPKLLECRLEPRQEKNGTIQQSKIWLEDPIESRVLGGRLEPLEEQCSILQCCRGSSAQLWFYSE
jgi:hypothetical protein